VTPKCPLKKERGKSLQISSQFEQDLLEYLNHYGPKFLEYTKELSQYDWSVCRAILIGSVPGRHAGEEKQKWGHLKLREALKHVDITLETSSLVIQVRIGKKILE
jgi:hypothetical protein